MSEPWNSSLASLQNSAGTRTLGKAEPLPSFSWARNNLWAPVPPGLTAVPQAEVLQQCPHLQPRPLPADRASQKMPESTETVSCLLLSICLPTATLRPGDKHTDKGQVGILHWFPGQITQMLGRRNPCLLHSKVSGKAISMIIPRICSRAREWEHLCPRLCSGCGSGTVLRSGGHQLESRCLEEALAGRRRKWLAG